MAKLDYGDSSQTPTIRKAVKAVNPKKLDKDAAPDAYEAVKSLLESVGSAPVTDISLDNFATDKARGRLILAALASLRPRRSSGELIDLAREFERHGPQTVTDLVRGRSSNAAARAFWPSDEPRFTGDEDPIVLAGHAIDDAAASLYRQKDIDGFLTVRAAFMRQLTIDFINSRLEPGTLVRPPLDELIVADDTE